MADISLNPTTPVTNGSVVSASNPLPVTQIASLRAFNIDIALNPKSLVTNGAVVSATNPLPITLV